MSTGREDVTTRRRAWLVDVLALAILLTLPLDFARAAGSGGFWERLAASASILPFVLVTLFTGWSIARRRPHLALGWLLLAIPGLFSVFVLANLAGMAVQGTNPALASWLFVIGGGPDSSSTSGNWMLPIGLLLTQIPLRFPDGRPPSLRWTWLAWYAAIGPVAGALIIDTQAATLAPGVPNPIHIEWGALEGPAAAAALVLGLAVPAALCIASLFVRYRSGSDVERTQLRWIFWAMTTAMSALVLSWTTLLFGGDTAPGALGLLSQAMSAFGTLVYALIPLSILFAVLRYDLYAIDRVISRTASYAIVTAVIVAGYVAIIVGLTAVIPRLPSVAVAVATLAAAAAFLPLLRAVRRRVDRRFNRAAYDAQKVADGFGERVRNGADPHTAAADLARAVDDSLQPTALAVWTRTPS
ncbi:hypothetical protein [Microbacterium candidum]|uniref:Uncharacterized protein n=1 Tax=Microbacterium candidum TaxID=3041922 RepID=A0ABT7N2C7_9MICO|nr:hypothetical protein [Microbacterium sp. ASV49]MDL9980860.1 hypothetical protein [Microbacterium sp. ASV49]